MERRATARHRGVARALRTWRTAAGLELGEAAGRIGWQDSKLHAYETAVEQAGPLEVIALATAMGIDDVDRDRTVELVWSAHRADRTWGDCAPEVLGGGFKDFVIEESDAAEVRAFSASLITDLLRTEDYSAALLHASDPQARQGVLDERRRVLLRRQAQLGRLRLHAIIHPAALETQVGGPSVMAGQFDHLIALGQAEAITVQLLPGDAAPGSAYQLAVAGRGIVTAAYAKDRGYLDGYDDLDACERDFAQLRCQALTPEVSIRRIAELRTSNSR